MVTNNSRDKGRKEEVGGREEGESHPRSTLHSPSLSFLTDLFPSLSLTPPRSLHGAIYLHYTLSWLRCVF